MRQTNMKNITLRHGDQEKLQEIWTRKSAKPDYKRTISRRDFGIRIVRILVGWLWYHRLDTTGI